jgi:pilus assembly protein Flp/PilA
MKIPGLFTRQLLRDESGQDIIEYALIGAVLALAIVASMKSVQTSITTVFSNVTSNF